MGEAVRCHGARRHTSMHTCMHTAYASGFQQNATQAAHSLHQPTGLFDPDDLITVVLR